MIGGHTNCCDSDFLAVLCRTLHFCPTLFTLSFLFVDGEICFCFRSNIIDISIFSLGGP